jgi:adenylate cyclase
LVIELRAKSRITGIFGTYVSPDVVKQMIASGEEPKLGGEQSEITAFFSDIAGFSSFSEKLPAERLVHLMNDYLTEMTDILHDNGGTLDKFIGDAIVGMFGAPLFFKGHAYHACRAALLMQQRQLELREKWRKEGDWPDIVFEMQTRIGLNSGQAIIGNMGSRRRFNYTMMGDTVNLAARSESGAKSYGVYTMITSETKTLSQSFKDDITFRFLDRIVVKGRSQPVEMYELVGFDNEMTPEIQECLSLHKRGMERYLDQDWDGAAALFQRSAMREIHQASNPSLVMLQRCAALKNDPPPADWDGVYVMKTK